MINYVEQLLNDCDVTLLVTNGEVGFPECQVLTKPLVRNGCRFFTFCLDHQKTTLENIYHNTRGSLFFFHRDSFQSILLKGIFSVEAIEKYKYMESTILKYQQLLELSVPTIVCFETLKVDLIENKKLIL